MYSFPNEAALKVPPNKSAIASLEYKCNATGVTCTSAETLKTYVEGARHKKALEKAGQTEDPTIHTRIRKFIELEKPHREVSKAAKAEAGKAQVAKWKAEKESMSKEEFKELQKERKRKAKEAEENGEPSKKKAKKNKTAEWTCPFSGNAIRGQSAIEGYTSGRNFAKKVKAWKDGSWTAPPESEFSDTGKLKQQLGKLKAMGIQVDTSGAGAGMQGFNPQQMMAMMQQWFGWTPPGAPGAPGSGKNKNKKKKNKKAADAEAEADDADVPEVAPVKPGVVSK